ncbi:hypothetical protein ACA910_018320 [Epithemia clementina (nom. ined.)]
MAESIDASSGDGSGISGLGSKETSSRDQDSVSLASVAVNGTLNHHHSLPPPPKDSGSTEDPSESEQSRNSTEHINENPLSFAEGTQLGESSVVVSTDHGNEDGNVLSDVDDSVAESTEPLNEFAVTSDQEMSDAIKELRKQQQQEQQTKVSTSLQKDPPEGKPYNAGQSTPGTSGTSSSSSSTAVSTGTKVTSSSSSSSSAEDDDDDVTSKAAVALAAVAAAATANHKSPAEAAAQARAVAQTFLGTNSGKGDVSHNPNDPNGSGSPPQWRRVRFKNVQRQLRSRVQEASGLSSFLDHLAREGDNACFLQQLLLLEYFQCLDDDEEDASSNNRPSNSHNDKQKTRGDDPPEGKDSEKAKTEEEMATLAAERILSVLRKIEGAYESLLNILPPYRKKSTNSVEEDHAAALLNPQEREKANNNNGFKEDYETETSVVVPDLLPPCTTAKGDSTLAFFRECCIREAELPQSFPGTSDSSSKDMAQSAAADLGDEDTDQAKAAASKNSTGSAGALASPGRATVSSMLGMFRRASGTSFGVMGDTLKKQPTSTTSFFRRKDKSAGTEEDDATLASESTTSAKNPDNIGLRPGEYVVKIEREMLGLTVENVLERTVVRTVLAGGPAKRAGAKVGSLIVKVGNIETKNLTHFETIDELRQSQRPLILVLKQLSEESLRAAREEMGRLIRGAGFGAVIDSNHHQPQLLRAPNENSTSSSDTAIVGDIVRPLIAADLRMEAFTNYIRRRLASVSNSNTKEEGVSRAAEKLIWILILFVFGLEREIYLLPEDIAARNSSQHHHGSHLYQHTLKEYTDSAKSAAKVLLDFTRKRTNSSNSKGNNNSSDGLTEQPRRRKGGHPPPPPPLPGRGGLRRGKGRNNLEDSNIAHEKPLLQIGDVLQRTRTFLADTTSPPAALLRGEVIALLCDILDVDTEMEMSEEDSISATSGAQAGPINDLGSAGSLLKLIVLNCPIMRSPICESLSGSVASMDSEWVEELRRKLGKKDFYSSQELHRLHAGNRFLAVVHRLAASRSMSARITACSLGPVIWGHLDFPHQLQLRGVITRALHDVEVMVRKATANVLHEIAELVFDARCVPWLVLMCERSMTDPEPQMRSAAMTLTWHLAEHLPNTFLGDASQGSRYLRRLPDRNDPIFADVYLLQCKLLPVATRLAEDRSPSVRLAVAAQCDRLCDALGDHWSSVVIDVLLGLLSDPDERVRCEAVMCVPRLAGIVLLSTPPGASVSEVSILEALVPASIRLQKDTVAVVRVALASAAGELLTLLVALQGRAEESPPPALDPSSGLAEVYWRYKKQVDERLVPLVQTLLNDQDPEVTSAALRAVTNASRRSTAITSQRHRHQSATSGDDDSASVTSLHSHASRENRQPVFLPVLSEVQVLRLLPTLSELADSKQWRVRQSAVEIVPALLGCTQKLETRTEISHLCVRLMSDKVDEVRKTAAECLCMGGSSLGSHGEDASSEWFTRIVIPAIRRCATHQNSKQRLLSLKMVEIILLNGACPSKWKQQHDGGELSGSPTSELVATALSLCDDRIANVRLNVGRILESVLHVLGADDLSSIVESVGQQLQNEKATGQDRDVIFFASRCTARAKALREEMVGEGSTTLITL